MSLEKIVKNFGLNDKEAKVYLACLELGTTSVPRLSQQAKLPKSTVYGILDKLKEKDLVSTFFKKRVRYFSAEDPIQAIEVAEEKIESLQEAIPDLRALWGEAKNKPAVRFYQGKTGMKIILKQILEEAKEILAFSSAGDIFKTLNDYFPLFVKERHYKKIPMKVLLYDSPEARERQRKGQLELREVRIIPSVYAHHGAIIIWKNKIAMFALQKELAALVIESAEMVLTQKMMFNFIWETIKK